MSKRFKRSVTLDPIKYFREVDIQRFLEEASNYFFNEKESKFDTEETNAGHFKQSAERIRSFISLQDTQNQIRQWISSSNPLNSDLLRSLYQCELWNLLPNETIDEFLTTKLNENNFTEFAEAIYFLTMMGYENNILNHSREIIERIESFIVNTSMPGEQEFIALQQLLRADAFTTSENLHQEGLLGHNLRDQLLTRFNQLPIHQQPIPSDLQSEVFSGLKKALKGNKPTANQEIDIVYQETNTGTNKVFPADIVFKVKINGIEKTIVAEVSGPGHFNKTNGQIELNKKTERVNKLYQKLPGITFLHIPYFVHKEKEIWQEFIEIFKNSLLENPPLESAQKFLHEESIKFSEINKNEYKRSFGAKEIRKPANAEPIVFNIEEKRKRFRELIEIENLPQKELQEATNLKKEITEQLENNIVLAENDDEKVFQAKLELTKFYLISDGIVPNLDGLEKNTGEIRKYLSDYVHGSNDGFLIYRLSLIEEAEGLALSEDQIANFVAMSDNLGSISQIELGQYQQQLDSEGKSFEIEDEKFNEDYNSYQTKGHDLDGPDNRFFMRNLFGEGSANDSGSDSSNDDNDSNDNDDEDSKVLKPILLPSPKIIPSKDQNIPSISSSDQEKQNEQKIEEEEKAKEIKYPKLNGAINFFERGEFNKSITLLNTITNSNAKEEVKEAAQYILGAIQSLSNKDLLDLDNLLSTIRNLGNLKPPSDQNQTDPELRSTKIFAYLELLKKRQELIDNISRYTQGKIKLINENDLNKLKVKLSVDVENIIDLVIKSGTYKILSPNSLEFLRLHIDQRLNSEVSPQSKIKFRVWETILYQTIPEDQKIEKLIELCQKGSKEITENIFKTIPESLTTKLAVKIKEKNIRSSSKIELPNFPRINLVLLEQALQSRDNEEIISIFEKLNEEDKLKLEEEIKERVAESYYQSSFKEESLQKSLCLLKESLCVLPSSSEGLRKIISEKYEEVFNILYQELGNKISQTSDNKKPQLAREIFNLFEEKVTPISEEEKKLLKTYAVFLKEKQMGLTEQKISPSNHHNKTIKESLTFNYSSIEKIINDEKERRKEEIENKKKEVARIREATQNKLDKLSEILNEPFPSQKNIEKAQKIITRNEFNNFLEKATRAQNYELLNKLIDLTLLQKNPPEEELINIILSLKKEFDQTKPEHSICFKLFSTVKRIIFSETLKKLDLEITSHFAGTEEEFINLCHNISTYGEGLDSMTKKAARAEFSDDSVEKLCSAITYELFGQGAVFQEENQFSFFEEKKLLPVSVKILMLQKAIKSTTDEWLKKVNEGASAHDVQDQEFIFNSLTKTFLEDCEIPASELPKELIGTLWKIAEKIEEKPDFRKYDNTTKEILEKHKIPKPIPAQYHEEEKDNEINDLSKLPKTPPSAVSPIVFSPIVNNSNQLIR